MSPNVGGMPAANRPRMSPHPQSPYTSPFNASPYAPVPSPYSATSPPAGPYHPPPHAPPYQTQSSFNQPQPYHPPQHSPPVDTRPPPPQPNPMPPPKVPASKAQDGELEKATARDMDVNNISDVLTGSGIDLRAEEEYLTHSFGARNQDTSFYSQGTATSASPHGSFNNWAQAGQAGAFRGTGPLSQKPMTEEELNEELIRKHEVTARAYAESAQQPLSDPFLLAGNVRHKIATCAYQSGIQVNLEGVFDKIPDAPQNVKRTKVSGPNGELVVALQADSLLNHNAPFVELLSLISLAAEERCRTVLEDAFSLAQNRQQTADGIIPPDLADIAAATGTTENTTTIPRNISKTPWENPSTAASPPTTANKNTGRLPTPPTEAPPTLQPTVAITNPVVAALKKRVLDDYKYEKERVAKRQKRLQGSSTTADAAPIAPLIPEKLSKKERDRINKAGQSDEHVHRRANETASLALGGKKKYSWMMGGGGGGGGGGSGASTPRISAATGAASGTATPSQPTVDRLLIGARRTYGAPLPADDVQRKIQLRDIIHVLDVDGRHRKTVAKLLAQPRGTEMDEKEKRAVTAR